MSRPALRIVSSRTRSQPSVPTILCRSAALASSSALSCSATAPVVQGRSRACMSRSEPRRWIPEYAAAAAITDVPGAASALPPGGQQSLSGQQ